MSDLTRKSSLSGSLPSYWALTAALALFNAADLFLPPEGLPAIDDAIISEVDDPRRDLDGLGSGNEIVNEYSSLSAKFEADWRTYKDVFLKEN